MNISAILITITVSEPDRDLAGGSGVVDHILHGSMCMQDRDHLWRCVRVVSISFWVYK